MAGRSKPAKKARKRPPRGDSELYDETYTVRILSPGSKPYFRVTCIDPASARLREISGGRTLDEARRRAATLVAELDAGAPTEPKRRGTTLERAAEIWLEAEHPRWSPRNKIEHASRLRVHVVSQLGHRRMGSLAPTDMRAVLASVRDKGLAKDTITNVGRTLVSFTKWAQSENYTGRALMEGVVIADYAAPNQVGLDDDDDLSGAERGSPVITATMVPDVPAWRALAVELRQGKLPWMGLACEPPRRRGYGTASWLAWRRPTSTSRPASSGCDVHSSARATGRPTGRRRRTGPGARFPFRPSWPTSCASAAKWSRQTGPTKRICCSARSRAAGCACRDSTMWRSKTRCAQ